MVAGGYASLAVAAALPITWVLYSIDETRSKKKLHQRKLLYAFRTIFLWLSTAELVLLGTLSVPSTAVPACKPIIDARFLFGCLRRLLILVLYSSRLSMYSKVTGTSRLVVFLPLFSIIAFGLGLLKYSEEKVLESLCEESWGEFGKYTWIVSLSIYILNALLLGTLYFFADTTATMLETSPRRNSYLQSRKLSRGGRAADISTDNSKVEVSDLPLPAEGETRRRTVSSDIRGNYNLAETSKIQMSLAFQRFKMGALTAMTAGLVVDTIFLIITSKSSSPKISWKGSSLEWLSFMLIAEILVLNIAVMITYHRCKTMFWVCIDPDELSKPSSKASKTAK